MTGTLDRIELDLVRATIIRLHSGREISDKERGEFEALVEVAKAAQEMRGYVRAQLAGNDATPELEWAAEQYDAALARLEDSQ